VLPRAVSWVVASDRYKSPRGIGCVVFGVHD
jgi:hypothetical protein